MVCALWHCLQASLGWHCACAVCKRAQWWLEAHFLTCRERDLRKGILQVSQTVCQAAQPIAGCTAYPIHESLAVAA